MSDVSIRLAELSDRDSLARMCADLWPQSTAEEHAQELTLILEGKPVVTLPLVIFVAETSSGALAGFLEVDLRSHADGCNPSRPVGYVEGWYVTEITGTRESARSFWPRPKTGYAAKGAWRSRPIPGSTMKYLSAFTRR